MIFKKELISNQKIIVNDGLTGGGKGLLGDLVSSLPKVDQWFLDSKIEQIANLYGLKMMNLNCSSNLIIQHHNQVFYDNALLRNVNFRKSDLSSIFNHPRIKIIRKRLDSNDKKVFQKIKNNLILHYCTHSINNYSEPLFRAFKNKLVFLQLLRSPLNVGLIKRIGHFSEVWSKLKEKSINVL